jgi:excisionase family DNA binding protein
MREFMDDFEPTEALTPSGSTANRGDYATVAEAAAILGKSVPTIYRWLKAGKLTAFRNPLSGRTLIPREELLEAAGWV